MATKSLLLSCLLMGLGAAISTANSTRSGYEATILPPDDPEDEEPMCDPWAMKRELLSSAPTVLGTLCFCSSNNPYWLKPDMFEVCTESPEMGLVMMLVDFCAEDSMYPDFALFLCTSFEDQSRACNSHPQDPECQHFSQVLERFGSPYWDDSEPKDESPPFIWLGDQSETLHRRQDVPAVVSKLTHQDTLERRDADEPYHPVLKRIFEGCDALEDAGLWLECVIKEMERALGEQQSGIIGREYVWADRDDEVPFNPVASDNNEDGSHSHRRVTATPRQDTIKSLPEWDNPLPYIREAFQSCQNADNQMELDLCDHKVRKRLIEECLQAPDDDAMKRCLEAIGRESG